MKTKVSFTIILLICFISSNSQEIQGYVSDKTNNINLGNINIEAIYQNDTTKRKITTTDNLGFFQLNNI